MPPWWVGAAYFAREWRDPGSYGAFKPLRGKGGIRCVPLDDGVLRTGKSAAVIVGA